MKDSISITWHINDIKSVDGSLTDDQAREVLQVLKKTHDASIGINWEIIDYVINEMREKGELK